MPLERVSESSAEEASDTLDIHVSSSLYREFSQREVPLISLSIVSPTMLLIYLFIGLKMTTYHAARTSFFEAIEADNLTPHLAMRVLRLQRIHYLIKLRQRARQTQLLHDRIRQLEHRITLLHQLHSNNQRRLFNGLHDTLRGFYGPDPLSTTDDQLPATVPSPVAPMIFLPPNLWPVSVEAHHQLHRQGLQIVRQGDQH